jgi:hypothetical protein
MNCHRAASLTPHQVELLRWLGDGCPERDWPDHTQHTTYKPVNPTIAGLIDDDIIRYRVTFDPVLALLRPPRMRYLRGRDQSGSRRFRRPRFAIESGPN